MVDCELAEALIFLIHLQSVIRWCMNHDVRKLCAALEFVIMISQTELYDIIQEHQ